MYTIVLTKVINNKDMYEIIYILFCTLKAILKDSCSDIGLQLLFKIFNFNEKKICCQVQSLFLKK